MKDCAGIEKPYTIGRIEKPYTIGRFITSKKSDVAVVIRVLTNWCGGIGNCDIKGNGSGIIGSKFDNRFLFTFSFCVLFVRVKLWRKTGRSGDSKKVRQIR